MSRRGPDGPARDRAEDGPVGRSTGRSRKSKRHEQRQGSRGRAGGGGSGRRPPARPGRGRPPRSVRPLSQRQRPLWMLIPGGVLMTLIIVIPLLIGVWISLTRPRPVHVAPVAAARRSSAWRTTSRRSAPGLPARDLDQRLVRHHHHGRDACRSGSPPRSPPRTGSAAAALVRSIFLIPYVLPSFVVGDGLADHAAAGRHRQQPADKVGIDDRAVAERPEAYWALILVRSGRPGRSSTCWPCPGCSPSTRGARGGRARRGAMVAEAALRGAAVPARARSRWPACWPRSTTSTTSRCRSCCSACPPRVDVKVLPVLIYVTSFQSLRFGLSAPPWRSSR